MNEWMSQNGWGMAFVLFVMPLGLLIWVGVLGFLYDEYRIYKGGQ